MSSQTEDEILEFYQRRNELQHEVILAVQNGDPLAYINVFSDKVPEIVEIDKQIFAWENQGNTLKDLITKVSLVSSSSNTEFDDYEGNLCVELMNRGFHSLTPDNKDRKRIEDMLKKSSPESAASRMQQATSHKDKLFRRGKVLMEVDRPDLAKGFWTQLGTAFGVPAPKAWGGSGVSPTGPSSVKIKSKSDYSDDEKIDFFDSMMEEVTFRFREVVERGDEIEPKAISTFIRATTMLGSEASKIINEKLNS